MKLSKVLKTAALVPMVVAAAKAVKSYIQRPADKKSGRATTAPKAKARTAPAKARGRKGAVKRAKKSPAKASHAKK